MRRQRTIRERLRRVIYLHALSHRYARLSFEASGRGDPEYRRIVRTSNRLGWLINGKSPWFDESAIHGNSLRNRPPISLQQKMHMEAETTRTLEALGIKMDAESRAKRRAIMEKERKDFAISYAQYLERGPWLLRVVAWLEGRGFHI